MTFNGATALRRWKRRSIASAWAGRMTFNGATALRRWKREMAAGGLGWGATLQWSHRPSAMETAPAHRPPYPPPRPSMEPPPFGDGNFPLGEAPRRGGHPSMEPPPFGDGNTPPGSCPRRRRPAFNGATALRRWKPARPLPNGPYDTPFNGATALRRWKQDSSKADRNGA